MKYGIISGLMWGLDTVVLGIALATVPFIGTAEAVAFAAVASAFLHDAFCAIWMFIFMGAQHRLKDTIAAIKTHSGFIVMLGALLGGPLGMTGYLVAINNIGPAYTAIISAFYPAFGALLSFIVLKEKLEIKQIISLFVAMGGVMTMGYISSGQATMGNPIVGLLGAAVCVVGWGSEAVLCAWGMKDDLVDNETALQIRETTSALVYGLIVLPLYGAWTFTASSIPTPATAIIVASALAGTISYLSYYKGISKIGASKCMALNISYSCWAVVFGVILLGTIPSFIEVICCIVILVGTVLTASDWNELFSRQ